MIHNVAVLFVLYDKLYSYKPVAVVVMYIVVKRMSTIVILINIYSTSCLYQYTEQSFFYLVSCRIGPCSA